MSEISERYRRVSDQFLARLEKVPDDADPQIRMIAFLGRTP